MSARRVALFALMLSVVSASGCSRKPGRLHAPSINASSAGSQAVEMYDSDHDGKIGGAELDQCPALKAAMPQIDTTGKKAITADMIAERVKAWQDSKVGRISLSCTVRRNGRPLSGAEVRFVPEKFLGDDVAMAKGTTNANGVAIVSVETTNRSDPPGLAPGLYRVEITKAGENVPAKYNTATTLGQEVALDAAGVQEGFAFDLTY